MSSTYIDLHNLSEITVDAIDVSNLNCDSIITTDLTVSGYLTGLNTSTNSIFNYIYNSSTRTFSLILANQSGPDYIIITNSSGVPQWVLFSPLIYPLLSATAPILYDNITGVFSLDTIINQNETFNGLLTATNNVLSTISQCNKPYMANDNGNHFNPLLFFQNAGVLSDGYKSINYDSALTLVFNPNTHEFRITGAGANLHLHNTATLTADSSGSFAGLLTMSNGNNVQGTNYSAYFGTSNSKSAQCVFWDGLAVNQYAQLYCRSNVFGVQGNITSISLQKNTFITGTLDATTGVNISTGQTYKINNIALTTDNIPQGATNKYLNSLTATSPILYNSGTNVVSLDTTSNINLTGLLTATSNVLSTISQSNLINVTDTTANLIYSLVFNTPAPGYKPIFSNVNLKYQPTLQRLYTPNLTVSTNITTVDINATNLIVSGTVTIPDYSITNVMLDNSSIVLNGQDMALGGTYSIPALSITNGMIASNAITLPKIDSSVYSTINTGSKLVQRDAFGGGINVGGINCTSLTYASGPVVPCTIMVGLDVPTTYPTVSTASLGYYQNDYVSLSGATVTLGSVAPLWDRVGGVNLMEVLVYSKSFLPVFKIEGQLVNFFIAPNSQVKINIGVFKNAPSQSITKVSNCIATTFVTRNIIVTTTQVTPFCCFYQEIDPTKIPGTSYIFTVYTQASSGVCNTGRAADDIPSHLMVTQIA